MKSLPLFWPQEAPFCLSLELDTLLFFPLQSVYPPGDSLLPTISHRWNPSPTSAEPTSPSWRECEAVKPCMSAWLERETLAWPGRYYFDFMRYFSLNWLEHFNQENSPSFPCPEWGAIQQCRFCIVTCQFNNLRGEERQIKLGWSEWGECSGWCLDIVLGPVL